MTALSIIADNLKKLLQQSDQVIGAALKKDEDFIEELNRDQLRKGQRADRIFNRLYRDTPKNRSRGRSGKPVQLFDTGDYYKRLTANVKSTLLTLTNPDSKDNKLTTEYGAEIKGLTPESVNELRIKIQPTLRNETLKLIQK